MKIGIPFAAIFGLLGLCALVCFCCPRWCPRRFRIVPETPEPSPSLSQPVAPSGRPHRVAEPHAFPLSVVRETLPDNTSSSPPEIDRPATSSEAA